MLTIYRSRRGATPKISILHSPFSIFNIFMSSAILALKRKYLNRSYHKTVAVQAFAVPWKAMYCLAIVLASMMLILYIYRVNQLTQGAYLIKSDAKEIKNLAAQNANLQASFEQTSFLSGVAEKAQQLGFQKTETLKYMPVVQGSLAEAR